MIALHKAVNASNVLSPHAAGTFEPVDTLRYRKELVKWMEEKQEGGIKLRPQKMYHFVYVWTKSMKKKTRIINPLLLKYHLIIDISV